MRGFDLSASFEEAALDRCSRSEQSRLLDGSVGGLLVLATVTLLLGALAFGCPAGAVSPTIAPHEYPLIRPNVQAATVAMTSATLPPDGGAVGVWVGVSAEDGSWLQAGIAAVSSGFGHPYSDHPFMYVEWANRSTGGYHLADLGRARYGEPVRVRIAYHDGEASALVDGRVVGRLVIAQLVESQAVVEVQHATVTWSITDVRPRKAS